MVIKSYDLYLYLLFKEIDELRAQGHSCLPSSGEISSGIEPMALVVRLCYSDASRILT